MRRSHRATRAAPVAMVLALLVVASGCGGPSEPLEAGVKEFPTDILLGPPDEQAPSPTPAPPPTAGVPFVIAPPARAVATPRPTATPTPPPCPTANPLAQPALEAVNRPAGAPEEGRYAFRNDGEFQVGDQTGTYTDSERTVVPLDERTDAFDYEVADTLGITTRYRVIGEEASDPRDVALGPGMYIVAISSDTGAGIDTFRPNPPIKLVAFPINTGDELDAAGTSASGDTVMRFHSRVGRSPEGDGPVQPKAKVDACGTWLQGWWIEITDGQLIGPGKSLGFHAWYALGTQFGSIPLLEEFVVEGESQGTPLSSKRRSVISSQPKVPS